jgi:hypothetical protein
MYSGSCSQRLAKIRFGSGRMRAAVGSVRAMDGRSEGMNCRSSSGQVEAGEF